MIIVCVDDDQTTLATVSRILRSDENVVRTTTSAAQALDWVAAEQIAVLVSDYNMPEMSGAKLASYAKNIQPTTVRILFTACAGPEAAIDGINQGEIFRFVNKPVEPRSFRSVVAAATLRHQELIAGLTVNEKDLRRNEMLALLERTYPGITRFELDREGSYRVYDDPLFAAISMDIDPALRDLLLSS
jgi:response regulator RpfG family c-di-GMP phosphodiesterase